MIEINLLPPEMRKREHASLAFPQLSIHKTLLLGVSFFIGAQILAVAFVIAQHFELTHVRHEVVMIRERNKEILAHKTENTLMKKRAQQLTVLTRRKFAWTSLLDALNQSMTKGIWLRALSLTEDKKGLKLEGSVIAEGQETATVGRFIKGLKDNPQFNALSEDIQLSNMIQKKIKEVDVYDFTLICPFKKDKI